MLNYEKITTEQELTDFVSSLNNITHYEQYLLFHNIFNTGVFDLRPKELPFTENTHFQKWIFPVGGFFVFATVKINKRNPIDNPDFKTGFYEKFYFHLLPDDPGISQSAL